MRGRRWVVVGIVAALSAALTGVAIGTPDVKAPSTASYPRGVHPYPSGDEWPEDLDGRFYLKEVRHEPVKSFDGTVLDGWIYLPDLPEGVTAPVVLWSHPYFGQTYPWGDDPSIRDNSTRAEAVPIDRLVSEGYAVAAYSVRGSGNSGGCLEMFGPNEQRDQAFLVEWLAAQDWSNGRVGMMGLSYHGTTPLEAAIHNPPSLKTVVVTGIVSDLYTLWSTPQGAEDIDNLWFQVYFNSLVTFAPPVLGSPPWEYPTRGATEHLPVVPERLCPEVVRTMTSMMADPAVDERDREFWDARRLIDHFPGVTASVFLAHGFNDYGHDNQEDEAWAALRNAPKRMLEGQWGHEFPNFNTQGPGPVLSDWNDRAVEWLDFWLKGIGAPPAVGLVEYQDSAFDWHESTWWPPSDARDEALYLTGDELSPSPGNGSGSFVAAPWGLDETWADTSCGEQTLPESAGRFRVYVSEPVEKHSVVAGNPYALLRLSSNLPGGIVGVGLVDLAEAEPCAGALGPWEHEWLTWGAADLRFHDETFQGDDFPTNEPTLVRVDMPSIADAIPAGHRLGLVVAGPGAGDDRVGQPYTPRVTIHADGGATASRLVLPIVEGSLGGDPTAITPPPRPFVPRPATDRLFGGQVLGPGDSVTSNNGQHELRMQADGNLVLYRVGAGAVWATSYLGTPLVPDSQVTMQSDGNLVLRAPDGHALWHTMTAHSPGSHLVVQNDGNVVLYNPSYTPRWATGTA